MNIFTKKQITGRGGALAPDIYYNIGKEEDATDLNNNIGGEDAPSPSYFATTVAPNRVVGAGAVK